MKKWTLARIERKNLGIKPRHGKGAWFDHWNQCSDMCLSYRGPWQGPGGVFLVYTDVSRDSSLLLFYPESGAIRRFWLSGGGRASSLAEVVALAKSAASGAPGLRLQDTVGVETDGWMTLRLGDVCDQSYLHAVAEAARARVFRQMRAMEVPVALGSGDDRDIAVVDAALLRCLSANERALYVGTSDVARELRATLRAMVFRWFDAGHHVEELRRLGARAFRAPVSQKAGGV